MHTKLSHTNTLITNKHSSRSHIVQHICIATNGDDDVEHDDCYYFVSWRNFILHFRFYSYFVLLLLFSSCTILNGAAPVELHAHTIDNNFFLKSTATNRNGTKSIETNEIYNAKLINEWKKNVKRNYYWRMEQKRKSHKEPNAYTTHIYASEVFFCWLGLSSV